MLSDIYRQQVWKNAEISKVSASILITAVKSTASYFSELDNTGETTEPDSAVGIAISYGLDRRVIGV
jgi:hypothetical protein